MPGRTALHSPFADNDFDAITVAFGIRNFEDLDKGLSEMCRVLKPGGHLVILELTTPERFPMKQLFSIYSKAVIPLLGKLLSKDNSAYRYLPDTIKVFPQGEIMKGVLSRAGFGEVNSFPAADIWYLHTLHCDKIMSYLI